MAKNIISLIHKGCIVCGKPAYYEVTTAKETYKGKSVDGVMVSVKLCPEHMGVSGKQLEKVIRDCGCI